MNLGHPHTLPLFPDCEPFAADITANRHRGSAESIAANPTAESKRESHERILELLKRRPFTGKEMAEMLCVPFNTISGRFSELSQMGKIVKTGVRRDGAAELTLSK